VLPAYRAVAESYEPEVWRHLMAQVQPGDTVADVGAFIGLYTVALAKRVGTSGAVISFEPNPENFHISKAHVELNGVSQQVELRQAAVGAEDGMVPFEAGGGSTARIRLHSASDTQMVQCVRLDTMFAAKRLDLLKIDVEGYEEIVLRGATNLLMEHARGPRLIYIEAHPYAWSAVGVSSESLLNFMATCGYRVEDLNGKRLEQVDAYGEIVARKCS
jgi:FkbM family methyltransferase